MEGVDFKTNVARFADSPIWAFHFIVPLDIAKKFTIPDRRVICCINSGKPFHCALMHNGSGGYFVNLNKDRMKAHSVHENDQITVLMRKDKSKYGTFTPDFFEELCNQDPEGSRLFHELTMGKQRRLLHILSKPKSEEKQLEKALIIFEYLKSSCGELDYKVLNEAFKNSRFKQ
jgi:hypothetical protein